MKALVVTATVAFSLSIPGPARADLNMRPGLWEATTLVGGNALPTEQKCYLQKDIETLEKFQQGGPGDLSNAPCRSSNYTAVGNRMTYTLTCEIQGKKSVSVITTVYDGEEVNASIAGVDGTIARVQSKWIGPCTESSFGN
jgi:hypothetical protein